MSREKFLEESFSEIGISLKEAQTSAFLSYCDILLERNQVMNLTAITEFDEIVRKHFIDSLLLSQEIELNEVHSMIDVGSGAGFPGIPLKIVFPDLQVVLIDSLKKRVGFLNEVINALHLEKIKAVWVRAEDAGHNSSFREKFDLCVSRAVAGLPALSEYCLPFVRQGGLFVAYKSANANKEFANCQKVFSLLGGGCARMSTLPLPGTDSLRTFVIVSKEKETPSKYPRKAGIPAKRPLS